MFRRCATEKKIFRFWRRAFLLDFAEENGRTISGFEHKAMQALHNHSWPGNVRELRNCIESAVVMCRGDVITVDDLPPSIEDSADQNCIRICTGSSLASAEKQIIIETLNTQKETKAELPKSWDRKKNTPSKTC